MITPNGRAAQTALAAVRPTVARLGAERHPEELAADLIDVWGGIETAMRSLLGGTPLAGQALIRELRQRELLTLERAHALLEFLAVRERLERADYHPTADDIAVARAGYEALERHLDASSVAAPAVDDAPPGPATVAVEGAAESHVRRRRLAGVRPLYLWVLLGLAVAALAIGGYLWYTSAPQLTERGLALYQRGEREQARRLFERAVRADPDAATPYILLGRIARETGDTAAARDYLTRAVRLDTASALAYRELGSLLFASGRYDLARNFYARAAERDPSDRIALGYLGCSLVRLGHYDLARRFLDRAGPGDWSACLQRIPALPPGMPPGAMPGTPGGPMPVAPPR